MNLREEQQRIRAWLLRAADPPLTKNIAFDSSDEEESFDERTPLVSRSGEELYKLAFEGEMYKTDPSQTSWPALFRP